MKKKLLAVTAAVIFFCSFGFSACDGCNKAPRHGHALTRIDAVPHTCTEDGNIEYYICEECGKWFEDSAGRKEIKDKAGVIVPMAHTLSRVADKPSTCFEDGSYAHYTCGVCRKWFWDESGTQEITDKESIVLKKGHKITFVPAKAPTCTADGNLAFYYCSGCGEWFEDQDGESVVVDRSDKILTEKNHSLTLVPEKEATCTENGNTVYYACGNCKKWFSDDKATQEITDKTSVVLQKGHIYKDEVCERCGKREPTAGLIYTESGTGCTVSGIGTAIDTEIYIADEYNGKKVTSIGESAFENCSKIISITLPDSIEDIGGSAFRNCTNLKSINIPDSVTFISGNTFENCASLESIALPDDTLMISDSAFKGCKKLTEIAIPDGVLFIGNSTFDGCESLAQIKVPEGVITVGASAFANCFALTDAVIEGALSIGNSAFRLCTKLTSVTLGGTLTSIGNYAFEDCDRLTSITFRGTTDRWYSIDKGYQWDNNTGNYTVICNDGSIKKS